MNIYDYILEKLAENRVLTDYLIKNIGDSQKILNLHHDTIVYILSGTRITEDSLLRFLKNKDEFNKNPRKVILRYAREIKKIRENLGVKIISYSDKEYPSQLKKIKEIPLNLYVRGNLDFDYSKSVSIVGTRKVSLYAREKIREISKDLSRKGICIISGLAYGVDGEAHYATISSGGKTIAVLPYISHEIYPFKHEPLAKKIIKSGGAIISENCFIKKQYSPTFLTKRNRIISGLSKGVFIVEGSKESGSLSQYNHAKRQKKIIFSLKPIKKHKADYLPRLIMAEQGNWITTSEEILRLLNKRTEKQDKIKDTK